MTDLLDVNLLISLAWPNHVHHRAALQWFNQRGPEPWATTPLTESGFVRVSSNRAAIPAAVSPSAALAVLIRVCDQHGHVFLPDDVGLVLSHAGTPLVEPLLVAVHGLVMDAHLLALARRHGARLATLDRGLVALAASRPQDVVLVPTGP
ncbi:MAG TPA: TA system VapC family ribonuclease toxin [Acidimicrobiales bacterium]|nr:TA system VapC family ribonuclease toxin [Acidimicrobiales bacterium]